MGVLPLAWMILKFNTNLKSLRSVYILCIWTNYQESKYTFLAFYFCWLEKQKSIALVSSVLPFFFFFPYLPEEISTQRPFSPLSLSPHPPSLYVDVCHHFSLLACEHCRLYIQILHFADFSFLGSVNFFCFFIVTFITFLT